MAHRHRSSLPEGDDGKTIADMNVDGMPWYVRDRQNEAPTGEPYPMSPSQMRAYRWASVKAGLAVVLIFAAVFGLFIAFCDFIWFN